MRPLLLAGVLALCVSPTLAQDWSAADRATRRLSPATFAQLPSAIRADLERRGCTVPQSFAARRPENVIRGRFTKAGQTDWAVLCSRERVSAILVFRGGSIRDVAEIESREDGDFLQIIDGAGGIGYSRAIAVADAKYIREHSERYGDGTPLPPLDHDGINDIFVEKASSVMYWSGGRWMTLPGAN